MHARLDFARLVKWPLELRCDSPVGDLLAGGADIRHVQALLRHKNLDISVREAR